jgi:hypothetical protein
MAMTLISRTIPTAATGNKPLAKVNRFGLGRVAAEPPAGFLSQGRFSSPQLLVPDQPGNRNDMGDPNMRYLVSSGTPAGSVGSISGATACRSVLAGKPATPATHSDRSATERLRSAKELWRSGDTATAADLESKLDPFPRSRDYQSPRRGEVHQRDIPARHPDLWSVGQPQVEARAATAAR